MAKLIDFFPDGKKGHFSAEELGIPISLSRVTQLTGLMAEDLLPLLESGIIHAFERESFGRSFYEPHWSHEFGYISPADLGRMYFYQPEIESLVKPQSQIKNKEEVNQATGAERLYQKLDYAIAGYYENTKNLPSDPRELDREIWAYPEVVRARKDIGVIDHASLKAGLRRYGLGKRLPKLTGGRGRKAVK
jgi:hypothetical protein